MDTIIMDAIIKLYIKNLIMMFIKVMDIHD